MVYFQSPTLSFRGWPLIFKTMHAQSCCQHMRHSKNWAWVWCLFQTVTAISLLLRLRDRDWLKRVESQFSLFSLGFFFCRNLHDFFIVSQLSQIYCSLQWNCLCILNNVLPAHTWGKEMNVFFEGSETEGSPDSLLDVGTRRCEML